MLRQAQHERKILNHFSHSPLALSQSKAAERVFQQPARREADRQLTQSSLAPDSLTGKCSRRPIYFLNHLALLCRCPKCFLNSSSELARPASVRTTDLALLLGSRINPFSYNRSSTLKSKPFHARTSSCRVRYINAKKLPQPCSHRNPRL